MHRILTLLAALSPACGLFGETGSDSAPTATAAGSATSAAADDDTARPRALLEAELSRNAAGVTEADLESRNLEVRRAASRALARIRGEGARSGLFRLLADEDQEVVAWAAYGLGDDCSAKRDTTVSALVAARGALLAVEPGPASKDRPLDAHRAIIRAVGRCASSRSEEVLVGWARARDDHAVDAVHALGDVARENGKLREESFVALLELASGNAAQAPIAEALYPVGRIEHLPPSVVDRALAVAKKRLETEGPARAFAVRTLTRCADDAVPLLRDILEDRARYTALERADAARGLGRFGREGQNALAAALPSLIPDDLGKLTGTAEVGVLLSALTTLTVIGKARPALVKLAELRPPEGASVALLRRASTLRCAAAQIVAERDFEMPLLRGCDFSVAEKERGKDPVLGGIGARAIVAAIGVDGVKLTGKRATAWRAYVSGGDLRARQQALELLNEHAEVDGVADVLAAALDDKSAGVIATAAQIIAKHPDRAQTKGKKNDALVHEGVAKSLVRGLGGSGAAADVEALVEIIHAAGALKLPDAAKALGTLCSSANEPLRKAAFDALASILGGAAKVKCAPPASPPLPEELARLRSGKLKVKLVTDAGDLGLELDATLAPIVVGRATELVKSAYYDGMVVHRVVPGFVSQFGSPTGDGYGGAPGMLAVPCETSPLPFVPLSVGVALSGRDTGSSQLFVTHAAYPHLDGKYAIIGTATGAWDALVEGDIIRDAELSE